MGIGLYKQQSWTDKASFFDSSLLTDRTIQGNSHKISSILGHKGVLEHGHFSHAGPKMKLSIFAIVLIGAVLATGYANANIEPEERKANHVLMEAEEREANPGWKNKAKNLAKKGLNFGKNIMGRADIEAEE